MKLFSSKYEKELSKALKDILVPKMKSLGYKFEGVSDISTRAIPHWYEGVFSNKSVNRVLSISYSPKEHKAKEMFACHISVLKHEFDEYDYTSTNQMSVPCKDISEVNKPLYEKYAQMLAEIRESLSNNFEEVLNGTRFETEHIDWQGLK